MHAVELLSLLSIETFEIWSMLTEFWCLGTLWFLITAGCHSPVGRLWIEDWLKALVAYRISMMFDSFGVWFITFRMFMWVVF